MRYEEIAALRIGSPAWRLLRADNAPLVLSFLGRVFVDDNVRDISASQLITRLDDELYALNERLGEGTYPKSAKAYLDDWAAPDTGWLRKFYPSGSDEPHYDATPAVEKAVAWVRALRDRSFVGTESRLNTLFELLRQLVYGSETDVSARLQQLYQRRQELDREIAAAEGGVFVILDPTARRDRYQQFAETARALLSDFREVEANFRLLEGVSFQAFYDLLLSSSRQQELSALLERVHRLDVVDVADPRLRYIHHDWLDAGERAQSTVRQLSEQLRRFLDDQVWLENRRVMELLRSIESRSLALRDRVGSDFVHEIDATAPTIRLPLERPLYARSRNSAVDSAGVEQGMFDSESVALFEQIYVDPAPLIRSVRNALQRTPQVALSVVVAESPITHGLSELVTYLSLDDEGFTTVFDESARDTVGWTDDDGTSRTATLPRVIYARKGSGRGATA
jgi:Protein of unknown function (DUF3375)